MGRRPLPPLIGWYQRNKSVLRGELIRGGRSTRVVFETADVACAVALMRLFVRHELDNGRLRRAVARCVSMDRTRLGSMAGPHQSVMRNFGRKFADSSVCRCFNTMLCATRRAAACECRWACSIA
jgi:hypothetical protein